MNARSDPVVNHVDPQIVGLRDQLPRVAETLLGAFFMFAVSHCCGRYPRPVRPTADRAPRRLPRRLRRPRSPPSVAQRRWIAAISVRAQPPERGARADDGAS